LKVPCSVQPTIVGTFLITILTIIIIIIKCATQKPRSSVINVHCSTVFFILQSFEKLREYTRLRYKVRVEVGKFTYGVYEHSLS